MSKTDQAVAEAIRKALDVADKTGDFVAAQAPDVVQQLLSYTYLSSLLASIAGVTALVAGGGIGYWLRRKAKDADYYASEGLTAGAVFSVFVGTLIGGAILSDSLPTLIKVTYAPKLFLLEYLAELVR